VQPMGFDQLHEKYDHHQVLAAKVTIQLYKAKYGDNADPVSVALVVQDAARAHPGGDLASPKTSLKSLRSSNPSWSLRSR